MGRGICNVCGRFYIKGEKDQEFCDECLERDKKQYALVKEYIMEHREASIMDVYYGTRVPVKSIKRFIEEERIRIMNN